MKPGSKYWYIVQGVRKLKPGEAMLCTQHAEFTCNPESFQNLLYRVAQAKGPEWVATSTVIGTSVAFAFYKRGDYMRPNLPAYPIVRKLRGER